MKPGFEFVFAMRCQPEFDLNVQVRFKTSVFQICLGYKIFLNEDEDTKSVKISSTLFFLF